MFTFVATPIGNIQDLSLRAIDVIDNASVVFCEDTRVAKKLINLIYLKIKQIKTDKQYISIHSHNEKNFLTTIEKYDLTKAIYISDAGMPCISDPGAILVDYFIEHDIKFDFIPGASALTMAYAMSGLSDKEFIFFGFLPHTKKDRINILSNILNAQYNTIIYEAPTRIELLLEEIDSLDDSRVVFVAKELTKLHQKIWRAKAIDIKKQITNTNGEWVVIIKAKPKEHNYLGIKDILDADIAPKVKAKLLSKIDNTPQKIWYERLIQEK